MSDLWIGKIPWRGRLHHTPVCLPGESHGQRSPVGYSPWGLKELDKLKQLRAHEHTHRPDSGCLDGQTSLGFQVEGFLWIFYFKDIMLKSVVAMSV